MTAQTETYRWMAPEGLRPSIPKNTHPQVVELFETCWDSDPCLRPGFSEILELLHNLQKMATEEGEDRVKHKVSEESSNCNKLMMKLLNVAKSEKPCA
ncbi:Serine/threonine-protein kinase STY17 [Linum perenne]